MFSHIITLHQVTSSAMMLAEPPGLAPSGGASGPGGPPGGDEEDNEDKRKKLKAKEMLQAVADQTISDDDELQWDHNKGKNDKPQLAPTSKASGKAGVPFPPLPGELPSGVHAHIKGYATRTADADRLLRDKYNKRRFICIACMHCNFHMSVHSLIAPAHKCMYIYIKCACAMQGGAAFATRRPTWPTASATTRNVSIP